MSKMVPKVRFQGFTGAWEQRKLTDITTSYSGLTYTPNDIQENGTLVLRSSNVKNNQIVDADNVYVKHDVVNSRNVRVGDVIVVVRNGSRSLIGKHAIVKEEMPNTVIGAFMSAFRGENGNYINALLSTESFGKEVNKSLGATINQITGKDFSMMKFLTPRTDEQEKIGAFFNQLDDLITLHQRKLDLLKEQKKGFLQKMFPKDGQLVPEVRFAGFTDDWEQRKLGEIVKKDTVKNNDLEFHSQDIISVAQMKDATTVRDSSDEYMMTYNKIRFGNIAFEGHANKEFPNGRFVLNDFRDGIVSHIYDVYIFIFRVDSRFMKKYINDPVVMRKILINSTSNARMMNSLNSKEFLKQKLLLPSFDEQQKIGAFFEQLDNLITLHQRKLDLLKEQKKGFLQKMFVS